MARLHIVSRNVAKKDQFPLPLIALPGDKPSSTLVNICRAQRKNASSTFVPSKALASRNPIPALTYYKEDTLATSPSSCFSDTDFSLPSEAACDPFSLKI